MEGDIDTPTSNGHLPIVVKDNRTSRKCVWLWMALCTSILLACFIPFVFPYVLMLVCRSREASRRAGVDVAYQHTTKAMVVSALGLFLLVLIIVVIVIFHVTTSCGKTCERKIPLIMSKPSGTSAVEADTPLFNCALNITLQNCVCHQNNETLTFGGKWNWEKNSKPPQDSELIELSQPDKAANASSPYDKHCQKLYYKWVIAEFSKGLDTGS